MSAFDHHDLNVIGAFAVAAADQLHDSAASCAPTSGASASALIALTQIREGRTIAALAGSLRVSHSRTVRIADDLEARGLVKRVPADFDGRAVHLRLTRKGLATAETMQHARLRLLEETVAVLTSDEVSELARITAKVLMATTTGRRHAQAICRLCDAEVCGFERGECPVTIGADVAEAARA